MTDNQLVSNIVTQIGISNIALAKLLGVHSSIFTRIATYTRPLPLKAYAALAQAHSIVANLPATSVPKPTTNEKADWQMQLNVCKAHLPLLQKQLQNMQTKYGQAATMAAFLVEYAAKNPTPNAQQQRWQEEQAYQAQLKMRKNGWQAQQQIQLKILLLQTEINYVESVLNE